MQPRRLRLTLLAVVVLVTLSAFAIAQEAASDSYMPYLITDGSSQLSVVGDDGGTLTVAPVLTLTTTTVVTGTDTPIEADTATNEPMATLTATPANLATITPTTSPLAAPVDAGAGIVTATTTPDAVDVTASVEQLGNPFREQYPGDSNIYPRNVWDMQLFGNKVYLGSGNSSNMEPNINAGPVAIWTYDLTATQFVNEATIDQEQIDLFRIINDTLYIPGHDPRSQRIGFYYLENGVWKADDTISAIRHVYDMQPYGAELFAALGTRDNAAVAVSTNNGQSWRNVSIGMLRVYSLLEVQGKLYAAKGIYTDTGYDTLLPQYKPELIAIYEYQGSQSFVARPDLKFSVLFPDYDGDINPDNPWHTIGKITRQVTFQDKLIYIGSNQFNDHQALPFGLFAAGPIEQAQRIALPEGARPWDTLVRDGTLYVLLGAKQADGGYNVSVISTVDLLNWTELFHFACDTFARSFELTPTGDFLFGLGTGIPTGLEQNDWSTWEMSSSAGDILRVPYATVLAARGSQ